MERKKPVERSMVRSAAGPRPGATRDPGTPPHTRPGGRRSRLSDPTAAAILLRGPQRPPGRCR
ncbi:hypothetical protein I79_009249 [Cricetulus griseus]|uniref:Uncharacterized protein n=1 Tax=Cricetulus griseus TaxID=10029 RepID=G3HF94_CRIGR|nr:hypothetical protein I79_009249 [Cricetulus griseus]